MQRPAIYTVHYRLKNRTGDVIDASEGGEPLTFMLGSDSVIKGIQEAVKGRGPGDCLEVTVPPSMAYGEHNPELVRRVPRSMFEYVDDLRVGMKFQTNTGEEAQVIKIVGIDGNLVHVDANHPLAGFTLYFDLEIVQVREANDDELSSDPAR